MLLSDAKAWQAQFSRCQDGLRRCRDELAACRGQLERSERELASSRDELVRCRGELQRCRVELRVCQEQLRQSRSSVEAEAATGCFGEAAEGAEASEAAPPPASQAPPAIADLFRAQESGPIEARLEDLVAAAEAHEVPAMVYQFSELAPGQSLQQHVLAQVQGGACPGPHVKGTVKYCSQQGMRVFGYGSLAAAQETQAAWWGGTAGASTSYGGEQGYTTTPHYQAKEWQSILKTLMAGQYHPMIHRGVLLGIPGQRPSNIWIAHHTPVVIVSADGRRHWGMLRQGWMCASWQLREWALRSQQWFGLSSSISFTVVLRGSGEILFQDRTSTSTFGCHGLMNRETGFTQKRGQEGAAESPKEGQADDPRPMEGFKFMDLLFHGHQEQLRAMPSTVLGSLFSLRVEITHPSLRSWMGLKEGGLAFYDVQVYATHDPITLEGLYIVMQTDVTAEVLAQRSLQQAHAQLELEKKQADLLLRRQYKLIECLGKVDAVGGSKSTSKAAAQMIEGVLQQIALAVSGGSSVDSDDMQVTKLLGEGSFGSVYKGTWQGTVVAIKFMVLPSNMKSAEKRERMAVMEAAISSSLSHPNVVQTYTYVIQPLPDSSREVQSQSSSTKGGGLEVRLVQEFCDCGSLRDAVRKGAFLTEGNELNYRAMLETAADIAKGMLHLHAHNILHLDLKAQNVLLKSTASVSRCVTAKIADFGLSLKMDHTETHVSKVWHGTPSHMAPEVCLEGHQSKAADVYAFGITLWELYTGEAPFKDVSTALLGHKVVNENLRPTFPPGAPRGYVHLAERCWAASAADRPSFDEILAHLVELRKAEGGSADGIMIMVNQA